MQYMLLCYFDERLWVEMPGPEQERITLATRDYVATISNAGQLRYSVQLQSTRVSTTIRRSGDKIAILDGPCAPASDHMGDCYLIECADLDEAISIAQRMPPVDAGGAVEIRPLR
jgi:hypothetical protein